MYLELKVDTYTEIQMQKCIPDDALHSSFIAYLKDQRVVAAQSLSLYLPVTHNIMLNVTVIKELG